MLKIIGGVGRANFEGQTGKQTPELEETCVHCRYYILGGTSKRKQYGEMSGDAGNALTDGLGEKERQSSSLKTAGTKKKLGMAKH